MVTENIPLFKKWIIVVILPICLSLLFTKMAQPQAHWPIICLWDTSLPQSTCYITPQYYKDYGYFNTINGYLLGYNTFTPFLIPGMANTLNTPTYPYFGSPYQTPFPYTSTPLKAMVPYTRLDYPTYTYGSSDFYLSWVLMQ